MIWSKTYAYQETWSTSNLRTKKYPGMLNTIVSHKYTPRFATLALVQSAGGAYTRDVTFSHAIMPSFDQEMFSGSVDAGFVLELPFHQTDLAAGELQC